jgi:hypothetical protein
MTEMLQGGADGAGIASMGSGFCGLADQKMICPAGGLRMLGRSDDSQNYPQRCAQKLLKTLSQG